ncbi:hypothetical protein C8F04DRAFT_1176365 [Mycena alexandri]|uniref:Uncharacterized protein n=1 Tax=Mycena alexandri TaxID=1745969 RepID=A0AAD6TDY8_9AGAR|nr:hypothetical protein C8F04DRAFT_1176365 [Mycena alexandri]
MRSSASQKINRNKPSARSQLKATAPKVSEVEMPEPESTPESQSKAQLQELLDALERITFGSQAGDVEAGNQLRLRLAELEQMALSREPEELTDTNEEIPEDTQRDHQVEDLVYIQNDKDDELVETTHNRSHRSKKHQGHMVLIEDLD